MTKRIIGAVGVGNHTFRAGQEAEFEAAATAAGVDFARLERKGVISGFSGTEAVEETADVKAEPTTTTRARGKKSARKR